MNELNNPPSKIGIGKDSPFNPSIAVNNPAPVITGIANKNENRAASREFFPNNSAALMVNPDLDIPGIIAIA